MKTQPTNADIVALVKTMHSDLSDRMHSIEQQAIKTNGRISKLEKINIANQAVENYKKNNHGGIDVDWKFLLGVGTIVAAALIAIGQELNKQ